MKRRNIKIQLEFLKRKITVLEESISDNNLSGYKINAVKNFNCSNDELIQNIHSIVTTNILYQVDKQIQKLENDEPKAEHA